MHLIDEHPAVCVFVGFWLFSAFAGGMPPPTDRSGVAYIWLHNSLQLAAGNLSKAIAVRYPSLAEVAAAKIEANAAGTAETLLGFIASNLGFFSGKLLTLRQYFAARFPLPSAKAQPSILTEKTFMATATAALASASKPNAFIRFIDKIGRFLVRAEPVAVEVAEEAEPILALTPAGPEYNVVVNAIVNAQKIGTASLAAGTKLTNEQKLEIAVSSATPALTTILTSKGVTTDHATHITNWVQAIFGVLAGPVVNIVNTVEGAKTA